MVNGKLNKTQLLFVGSYAPETQAGIYAFVFDPETGALTVKNSFTGIANPSYLAVHPNGRFLYAVSEVGQAAGGEFGAAWAFRIEPTTLDLQPINQQSTEGDWPCHVDIDASGRWLVASNYGSGNVILFPILANGALGESRSLVQHQGHGLNPDRQAGPHAHSAIFTPDNRFVIAADLGIDRLVVYQFDAETGLLEQQSTQTMTPGAGPRHMVFHPNGRFLYVANELDNSVTVLSYQQERGALALLQTLPTLSDADPKSAVADIHISASGETLYVSNRGHDSVAVYRVGRDGRLSLLATPSCGGNGPRNFALAENGRFMLVANQASNELSVLPIGANETAVGEAVFQIPVSQPSCVKFF